MSRNRSIAKRMGGEHTRTPKAGDKSYAKVLFSPDEMASFESLMNEVDDVGVGGKFITPRRGADAEDAPTSSFFRDWCTGLNAVVLVVLVVTAIVAVDFSRSYFPDRATAAGPRGARVDTTLEATPSPSPAARALAADLARAGREADPAGDAAAEGRRDALLAAGSGAGSVVAEKGGEEAQTEANAEDVSEAETRRRRGDAADPFATPPFPETSANAAANAAESDAWQSTAVGFGDTSGRQEQIAQDLADALTAMDANVTRSPPPPPSRGSRKSPPPRSDAARDAADAAEASAADAAEATSREARHEAAETDAERRARHVKEDEERRARHEKEDRERAEKHAMEDELRELRAAASEPAKDREPFSFGEAEATTSVGALVADDATSDSASDADPIMDPDDPARVSVPHGGDGGDDDAPPDETEVSDATVSDATVPNDVEPFPGRSADDAPGPFVRRPADDDAITSDATPAGRDSSSPVMNASSALPTDPGEGSPDAGVTRGDAEPEAAATPAATPRRAGARNKKASTRTNATNGAAKTSQDGFKDEDIVETADAPTAPPRNATTTPNAVSSSEDPTDDAASLSDAPRLPEADPSDPSDEPDEAPNAVWRVDADASHSLAAIADSPADYDHTSLRVGVNTTVTDPKTVNGGRLAPPSAANGTPPGEYALDARKIKTMTVKGLVQEPTDISDEAKRPPDTHAPEPPEPS